jgi:hypothetical protein
LLERGFCVYAINPKQLDRFRDRFTVAGAKEQVVPDPGHSWARQRASHSPEEGRS